MVMSQNAINKIMVFLYTNPDYSGNQTRATIDRGAPRFFLELSLNLGELVKASPKNCFVWRQQQKLLLLLLKTGWMEKVPWPRARYTTTSINHAKKRTTYVSPTNLGCLIQKKSPVIQKRFSAPNMLPGDLYRSTRHHVSDDHKASTLGGEGEGGGVTPYSLRDLNILSHSHE